MEGEFEFGEYDQSSAFAARKADRGDNAKRLGRVESAEVCGARPSEPGGHVGKRVIEVGPGLGCVNYQRYAAGDDPNDERSRGENFDEDTE
jgi:hypothetical protein